MPEQQLIALLDALEGLISCSNPQCLTDDIFIHSIIIDSRKVQAGSLFVALKGALVDGHRYVQTAIEKGAAAILVEQSELESFKDCNVPVLVALNTRAVLGNLAKAFFNSPLDKFRAVIGITGTNGKTTCSYIAESLLLSAKLSVGVIGTINYRWTNPNTGHQVVLDAPNTTPESLVLYELAHRMIEDGVEILVMEVSSHGLETHRLVGVEFDGAMFTNLTQDHLDFHGSMESYEQAKRKLFFEHLKPESISVLNVHDRVGRRWFDSLCAQRDPSRVVGYSAHAAVDGVDSPWIAASLQSSLEGVEVTLGNAQQLHIPLVGQFNVANVLGVLAMIQAMDLIDEEQLHQSVQEITGVPGRLQRVNPGNMPAVFVDYAHTPDALEHVLETLQPFCDGELWCVFGCGGDRDKGKRPQMGAIAVAHADKVMVTSDNPRREPPMQIVEDILAGIEPGSSQQSVLVELDRALAIRAAIIDAGPEDVVLIAGKGHENYQELATGRVDFCDVELSEKSIKLRG